MKNNVIKTNTHYEVYRDEHHINELFCTLFSSLNLEDLDLFDNFAEGYLEETIESLLNVKEEVIGYIYMLFSDVNDNNYKDAYNQIKKNSLLLYVPEEAETDKNKLIAFLKDTYIQLDEVISLINDSMLSSYNPDTV